MAFFRWRKSPVGQEMFGNGLLDQDSRPRRSYREAQKLGEDFRRLAENLPEDDAVPEVALVLDFADRMNAQIHEFAMDVEFFPHLIQWYRPARRLGLNVRLVRSTDDLSPFKLVLAPNQLTTSPEIVENFTSYVSGGGTLVGALRMGWFDVHGKPSRLTLPGGMADLFGIEVEEYERVMEPNPNQVIFAADTLPPADCRNWSYILNELGATALATYERDYYAGRTAISQYDLGDGHAVYVGTMLDDSALRDLMTHLASLVGIATPAAGWPDDVELVRLSDGDGGLVWAVMNHAHEERSVRLPEAMDDVLTEERIANVRLAPLGVRWLRG